MLDKITPLILTFNEAPNIGRTLDRLAWARDVVIIDSFSSDDTLAIVSQYPNARVFQRKFDNHARQWNFGLLETAIGSDWVLALDADYIVTEDFLREVGALVPEDEVAGYRVNFKYCINGNPLRAAVYPPVAILYRRKCGEYISDGHTQRIRLSGGVLDLETPIFHDDRKPLQHWLQAQGRYMQLEADKLHSLRFTELAIQDQVRKLIFIAPMAMFFYCIIVKGNILDGRVGLFYALQRSVAEGILSLYLLQAVLNSC